METVSIHALLAECDPLCVRGVLALGVSIHALLAECDTKNGVLRWIQEVSIHALLAECDIGDANSRQHVTVSIHALLAECDMDRREESHTLCGFNPRTPCGVRLCAGIKDDISEKFQSTHSLRSATAAAFFARTECPVSIHALLAECDLRYQLNLTETRQFQSTHSLRSATLSGMNIAPVGAVSIHALLAECDASPGHLRCWQSGFNPRTPCGVRLRPTLYIATQQSKSYFAPTSLKRPSLHGCSF